jgi:hypothetical protein
MAIAPVLKSGSYFDEGRAVTSQKKRGYINTVGEWAVPPRYDLAAGFKEGLAWVGAADLYGFVDPNGAEPIPLMYQNARDFCGGLASVQVANKWGYIDRDNRFLIEPVQRGAGACG